MSESWWINKSRDEMRAEAKQRFTSCSFPSHHRKTPRIFQSTYDATMNRAPSSHSRYDAAIELKENA